MIAIVANFLLCLICKFCHRSVCIGKTKMFDTVLSFRHSIARWRRLLDITELGKVIREFRQVLDNIVQILFF
jgi:hypothetical protein